MIDKSIFRAYDIRGIYEKNLSEDVMERIGRALATYIRKNKLGDVVIIGRDVRYSSKPLSESFINGVISSGMDIWNCGLTSFGVTLFTGWRMKNSITAYITASHNPPEWNGIKFYDKDCIGFFEHQNEEIKRIVLNGNFLNGKGESRYIDKKKEYIWYLKEIFILKRKLRIVVDCGNGSTSLIAPDLFEILGADVIRLFCKPDPNFPGRGPDVEEENLEALKEVVKNENADFGVAFDGDGDRLEIVDEMGNVVGSDRLGILIAKTIAKPKDTVVCNVENSMIFEKELEPMGIRVVRIPVGHTFLMQNVKKENAVLGVESSHHFVLSRYFPFDDGIIPSLQVAKLISKSKMPLSAFLNNIKIYPKKRINIECDDRIKFDVMRSLKKRLVKIYNDVSLLDGVRINFKDKWVLLRVSNTSPTIRLTIEALTERMLEKTIKIFKRLVADEIRKISRNV